MTFVDTDSMETRCYQNISKHVIGVVKLREYDGKPNGTSLKPGERIHLNSIEERLTRNAPKQAKDNPFANGELHQVDEEAERLAASEAAATVPAAPEETATEADTEAKVEGPSVTVNTNAPDPGLPPAAIPGAQDPRAKPAPVAEGSLEEVAADAATQAEDSGEPPTEEETAVDYTEETGVKVEEQDEQVEGERALAEEVGTATPEAKKAAAKAKAPSRRRKS